MNKMIRLCSLFLGLLTTPWLLGQGAHFHKDSTRTYLTYDWRAFEIGVEAGPCLTTFWSNKNIPYGMDWHYTAGAFFRYNFNYWVGIQSGINVERLGPRNEVQYTDVSGNPTGTGYVKIHNDYLTFPLLFRFNAIERKINLNFTIGGFFSYLFNSKETWGPFPPGTPGDPNPGQETVIDRTINFERFNGGLTFGAGLDYKFDFGLNLGIEVRNQLGLYHIPEPDPVTTIVRTNSLQFLFRLSWKFGVPTMTTISFRK